MFGTVRLETQFWPPLMLTALRFAIAAIAITPLLARLPLERPSAAGLVL